MPISQGDLGRGEPMQMPEATGPSEVPPASKLLHWLTAALVLVMFGAGVMMKQIGDGPLADALHTFHETAGIGMLGLVVVRLGYRLLAQASGRWRRGLASRPIHGVLYLALILVPLLGWAGVSGFGARSLPFGLTLPAIWPEGAGDAELLLKGHAWLAFALIGLVMVHIGIAIGDYIQGGGADGTPGAEGR